jgi:hypothetical protein
MRANVSCPDAHSIKTYLKTPDSSADATCTSVISVTPQRMALDAILQISRHVRYQGAIHSRAPGLPNF